MPLGLRLISHVAALMALAAFGLALGRTIREPSPGAYVALAFVAWVIFLGVRRLYFERAVERVERSPTRPVAPAHVERRASREESPLWAAGEEPPDPRVDLNAASVVELQALPGIGPVAAQRIVDERSAGGPFASVDDLVRVPGIGPAKARMLGDSARV